MGASTVRLASDAAPEVLSRARAYPLKRGFFRADKRQHVARIERRFSAERAKRL